MSHINLTINNNRFQGKQIQSKQRGATLITTLSFLALMTIVSVSAAKISILDVLQSSNELQKSILFQRAENGLKTITTVTKLYKPLTHKDGADFSASTGIYQLPNDLLGSDTKLQITDKKIRYQCTGFNGKAISLGPSVPRCDLYDFSAEVKKSNSAAMDRHNRGAGKEKPNPLKNSYLSK